MELPLIIQGGMGVGVSNYRLANAVSRAGHLGVISGVGPDVLMMRRLQLGDPDGAIRRAMAAYPNQDVAQRILDKYFVPGGKEPTAGFRPKPMVSHKESLAHQEVTVAGTFAEVWLAKEGHNGLVGINLLEKIQAPTLYWLYGAILAGVDVVIVGAGIPKDIPGLIDKLSRHERCEMKFNVHGASPGTKHVISLDPSEHFPNGFPEVKRPLFFPIISSNALARMLTKRANGQIDGFIIEMPTAGGHNAPPRGQKVFNDRGEPIYGERDEIDFEDIRSFGVPFWLAGSYGSPEGMTKALELGAQGIQVGSLFAFSNESGIEAGIKQNVINETLAGSSDVFTDANASPTGFPFKVYTMEGTHSEESVYEERKRVCDLGYLRHAYEKEDGSVGWRCPSEPVKDYVRKGGDIEETVGRKCLCNALLATIGLGQVRKDGSEEQPIVTCGDAVSTIPQFMPEGQTSYSAQDVIDYLTRDYVKADSKNADLNGAVDQTSATSSAPATAPESA